MSGEVSINECRQQWIRWRFGFVLDRFFKIFRCVVEKREIYSPKLRFELIGDATFCIRFLRLTCQSLIGLWLMIASIELAQAKDIEIRVAPTAVYYSGVLNGYFDSADAAFAAGKAKWDSTDSFTGNSQTAINLHPSIINTPIYFNGIPFEWDSDRRSCVVITGGINSCTVSHTGFTVYSDVVCPDSKVHINGYDYVFGLKRIDNPPSDYDRKFACVLTYPATEPCEQCRGNPILPALQEKMQVETDYVSATGGLVFQRIYQSRTGLFHSPATVALLDNSGPNTNLGGCLFSSYGASRSFSRTVCFPYVSSGTTDVNLLTPQGRLIAFSGSASGYAARADVNDRLSQRTNEVGATEWVLQRPDNSTEIYNAQGLLIRRTSIGGRDDVSYMYSDTTTPSSIAPRAGLLISMADRYGRQLHFTYDGGARMTQMTDPAGGIYQYVYDGLGNLQSVTYPDSKVRSYYYNEAANINNGTACSIALKNALTGIGDENGVRFATYKYACNGKAVSTEHFGGVEKYSFAKVGTPVTEIDPLGTTRSYQYSEILSVLRLTSTTQPVPGSTGTISDAISYDANGNIASRTDFQGVKTIYSYDLTRNLETSRVEGSGTPQARTITTAWHATYRLPLTIAEPKVLTTYAYDTSGNLLSKTVQATSDTTGAQGLSPNLVGTARTWSYTYNNLGQVLTATGPRTDVADKTTYTYDTSGNLNTITNAVGQATTLSNYDANGRVGLIADANGATTALTYSPRGWLTGKTATSDGTVETTTYGYDGVGQLTLVTLPDTSTVSYTYDPAHRLTNIADSLGNRITYTLDNMGNRNNEQVKDPSGALARQTSRVVDALNRLQQITGAVQ